MILGTARLSPKRAITVRLEEQLYDLLEADAQASSSSGEKVTVTGRATEILRSHLFSGGPLTGVPQGDDTSAADATPLSEQTGEKLDAILELLGRIAEQTLTVQDGLDDAHKGRYLVALHVLGALVQDKEQRSAMKASLEENLGPAPEVRAPEQD